jgi:serine/threonine protein kinase
VRRRKFNPDFFNIEATEWDDSGEKAIELQTYNDTLGVQLGTPGQPLLSFGVAKSARYPVNVQLIERITLTNNSATDKNFAFYVPRDENRFKLVLVPGYGVIKPSESTQIEVRFTLLMTTTVSRKIKFEVLGCGEQIIPLNVSGDVSTRLDPNEIDILGKPIGQGAFGTVYRGSYRGTQVAVKVLARQNELLKAQTEEFLKEIDLMHKLRSPFIVNFIGASYVPGKLCVVTEFMEKGSVAHILQKLKIEHVLRLKIAYDCAQAMAFLHNNGVMHRDLKPANLLVLSLSSSAEVSVKLADFGTSRTVTQIYQVGRYTNGWGTPGYMAPELLARGEYSGKVDVYAFGILLLELYIQKDPFSFLKKVWDLPEIVLRGNRPEIPAECPPEYSALITQCWAHLPENRPSFPDLVELLAPLFQAERARSKENKRRIAESGGAAPGPKGYQVIDGASNASGSDYHSNIPSNTLSNTNLSNTTSTGLLGTTQNPYLQQSGGFQQSGAFHNYYSNTHSNTLSNDPNNRAATPKGKERVTEGPEGERVPVTSLANLSNDFIDQDRRDLFESERKPKPQV